MKCQEDIRSDSLGIPICLNSKQVSLELLILDGFFDVLFLHNTPMPLKERNSLAVRILYSDRYYMKKQCLLFSGLLLLE